MPASQYLTLDFTTGRETMVSGAQVSTGTAQANQIPALSANGLLDVSLITKDVLSNNIKMIVASEALTAGRYVNIFSNAGTANVRLADATNDRPAHGFVRKAFGSGETAMVYMEGGNDLLSGLIPGGRMYLGSNGQATATVPTKANSAIYQFLGTAIGTGEIDTDIEDVVVL